VIRVFVNYDRVRIPKPIRDVGIVLGSDAKIYASEPKPIWATAFEAEDVPGAEAQRKASMFPGMIQVITPVVTIVTHPFTVTMDVGSLRMPLKITEIVVFRGMLFRRPLFGSVLVLGRVLRFAPLRSLLGGCRRPVRGNKSGAYPTGLPVLFPALSSISVLRIACNGNA
jgi:hypothetical protein